jgi:VIT1/CCC1 family predicted Fe2+/Mn2+ transporter
MGMALAALSTAIFGVGSYMAARRRQKDLAKKTPAEEKMQFESTLHKTVELFKHLDLGIDMQNKVADTITQDEQEWKSYIELQQVPIQKTQPGHLYKSTLAAVMANSTGAAMALLPWVLTTSTENAVTTAIYTCLPLLFITGLLKSKINKEPIWWGGIRQLLLGATLALAGYLIAHIFT